MSFQPPPYLQQSSMDQWFLKYLQPTWYFNLQPVKDDIPYFVDWDQLTEAERGLIDFDRKYSSHEVSLLDAAFQAWHKGFIKSDPSQQLHFEALSVTVADNYRFVKKYFHPVWAVYILLLRLFSLHSPIREIRGFMASSGVRKTNLFDKVYPHESTFCSFDSQLLRAKPKVSIVIPTLNRYEYLLDGLRDLEQQDYQNFDVIIVDQSEPFRSEFYSQFQLDIVLIRQEEKALWLARNTAIRHSDADWLLLYDDDSRVAQNWITQHLKAVDYFGAAISSGVSISEKGAKVPPGYRFLKWSDQLDTGNVLIHRKVFQQVGLFDRQFEKQRMGDGEFGLRAYLAGYKNISNSFGRRLHLKVGQGGLRQMGSWDAFRPRSFFAPRPIPSVLYLFRNYFGNTAAFRVLLKNIPPSIVPYRFKRNNLLLLIGSICSILLLPIVAWQVGRSWLEASRKLKEGPKIEYLEG